MRAKQINERLSHSWTKKPFQLYHAKDNIASVMGGDNVRELLQYAEDEELKTFEIFRNAPHFHSTTQDEHLILWKGNGRSYWDNMSKKYPELLKKQYKSGMNESLDSDNDMISRYAALGLKLELSDNIAKATKIKSKAAFNKPVFYYKFKTNERRDEYVAEYIGRVEVNTESDNKRKLQKKQAKENMTIPYEVGDLLYNSWGYDQTNIDFYQVVEVGKKSIKIREIEGEMVPSKGYSSMAGMTKPVKDAFVGEPITKLVQVYIDSDGKPNYYIKAEYGSIRKYNAGDKGTYVSWYA